MAERCPLCGRPSRIVSGSEGTSHYEPIEAERLALERIIEIADAPVGQWADMVARMRAVAAEALRRARDLS